MTGNLAAGFGPLSPDPVELIIGLIAFLIVFGILARVLFPRLQQTLQERTETLDVDGLGAGGGENGE